MGCVICIRDGVGCCFGFGCEFGFGFGLGFGCEFGFGFGLGFEFAARHDLPRERGDIS